MIVRILAGIAILAGGTAAVSDSNANSLQELEQSLLFPSNANIAEGKILAADACGSRHNLDGVSIDPTTR